MDSQSSSYPPSSSSSSSSSPLNIILNVTRFIVFVLLLISIITLFTTGGLIKSYTIGIFLFLLIVSICGYKNIANLGIFQNINFLMLLWCLPIIIMLVIYRKNFSDKSRDITDPLSIVLTILLGLNFTLDSILHFLGEVVKWVLRLSNVLLPIIIGLILATIILGVVFYWDKISTTVKLGFVALIVLGFIFLSNAENIIAYVTTNIISLGINLIVISAFIIINYFLYKFTENGLVSNVFQILSLLFLARWIYLYSFKFYGSSGLKTFTDTISPDGVAKKASNSFLYYLTDINFYCDAIKSLFSGVIKYFLLAIFLFYVIFTFYIYYKNSFEFLTTYKTLSLFGFIIIGVLLLILTIYSLFGGSSVKETGPYIELISKIGISFVGIATAFGLIIYALSKIMLIPSTVDQIITIINFMLLMGLIALILSIFNFNTSSSLVTSGNTGLGFIFNFIMKIILYIPCLIIDCSNILKEQFQLAKKEYTVVIILIIELLLIASRFLIPRVFNKIVTSNGYVITDKVYPLERKNHIRIPEGIKRKSKNIQYSISCWVYIHPVPTNTNEAYIENTSLVNCGNVPNIMFNAETGNFVCMIDTVDANGGKKQVVVPNTKINKELKVIYSRWNNVFINFIEGGMDIFMNGDLVISEPNIIPYQGPNGINIGSSPGIYGEMCNLVYYKSPLLAQNIKLLYESMKDMNPPVTI
jgi:hypothetical protein